MAWIRWPGGLRWCTRLPLAAALVSALAATGVLAQAAPDKSREWKLSVAVGPAFALGKAGERWAKLVSERSDGALPIVPSYGAALAQRDPAREFAALRDGAADLAVGSTLSWSAQVDALVAIGLPWIAPEAWQLEALASGKMKERLFLALEQAGVVPLAVAPTGHRALATLSREVRTPDDAAGLRVRMTATPFLTDVYSGLAMLPQATSFAAAQAAFRAGTLDAQEGAPATFGAARLDAVGVRHVLLWDAIAEIAVFAVNAKTWQGWTDAQRSLVSDAAQEVARGLPAAVRAEDDAALAELRKHGVTVTRLTASGRAAFAAAARGVYDRWAAVAGDDVVRAAEAAVKAAAP